MTDLRAEIVSQWNSGLTYRQIAELLGEDIPKVRNELRRAREEGAPMRSGEVKPVFKRFIFEASPIDGIKLEDIAHDGCRHVHGGAGLGLRLCGEPATKTGVTHLCDKHKFSYVRSDYRDVTHKKAQKHAKAQARVQSWREQ